jgi:hypothetical protein
MEAIEDEVQTIDLKDRRLNARCRTILSRLADDPQASIPGACRGWSETDAAYKFFRHPGVTAERILAAHREATMARCRQQEVVLLVQDTTELDYTHSNLEIRGLGVLDHRDRRGMHLHLNAAFTPEGCCLGVLDAEFITRREETIGQARQRAHLPIDEKESERWLKGYQQACELRKQMMTKQVVSIADREADIYEVFVEGQLDSRTPWRKADWIIRAKNDRSLPERAEDEGAWCYQKLWSTLESQPQQFRYGVDLQATPKRAARHAELVVRASPVTLNSPGK